MIKNLKVQLGIINFNWQNKRKIFLAPKKNISIVCTDNESESSSVIWDDTEMRSKGVNDKIN